MQKNLYVDFLKVDKKKKIIEGYASTEALDSDDEIVKKSAIKKSLDDFMKFANIREMHQPSAVGKAKEAYIDDKGLFLKVKVVDRDAWEKVVEKVYSGFSIGGEILKKVGKEIRELALKEISLVDRPANPEAVFSVVKLNNDKSMDKEIKKEETSEVSEEEKKEDEVKEEKNEDSKEVKGTDGKEEDEKVKEEVKEEEKEESEEVEESSEKMAKSYMSKLETFKKSLKKQEDKIANLEKRLSKVEDTPAESKGVASYAVEKGFSSNEEDENSDSKKVLDVIGKMTESDMNQLTENERQQLSTAAARAILDSNK